MKTTFYPTEDNKTSQRTNKLRKNDEATGYESMFAN